MFSNFEAPTPYNSCVIQTTNFACRIILRISFSSAMNHRFHTGMDPWQKKNIKSYISRIKYRISVYRRNGVKFFHEMDLNEWSTFGRKGIANSLIKWKTERPASITTHFSCLHMIQRVPMIRYCLCLLSRRWGLFRLFGNQRQLAIFQWFCSKQGFCKWRFDFIMYIKPKLAKQLRLNPIRKLSNTIMLSDNKLHINTNITGLTDRNVPYIN